MRFTANDPNRTLQAALALFIILGSLAAYMDSPVLFGLAVAACMGGIALSQTSNGTTG